MGRPTNVGATFNKFLHLMLDGASPFLLGLKATLSKVLPFPSSWVIHSIRSVILNNFLNPALREAEGYMYLE
jgi:hypothetical protein